MRPIHLATIDKTRPVLVLTARPVIGGRDKVTVAPITSQKRGLKTEVPVGRRHGLDQDSVVSCGNIETIDATALGRFVGFLPDSEEAALALAIVNAFDLHVEDLP